MSRWAAAIGFFESLIWLLALSQVFQHLDRPINYVAYAGGYGTGTALGVLLERRIALGLVAVRIITKEDATKLVEALRAEDFGVTRVAAPRGHRPVRLLVTVTNRQKHGRPRVIIRRETPHALVSGGHGGNAGVGEVAGTPKPRGVGGVVKG
jgi:uncharacterized protein YebE (UPF0316 family)